MHHVTVRRVAYWLWALIAGAAAAFGLIASRDARTVSAEGAGPPVIRSMGRSAFDVHCARCHDCAEVAVAGEEASRMVQFLAGHGDCGLDEDLAIVAYLASPQACAAEQPVSSDTGTATEKVVP